MRLKPYLQHIILFFSFAFLLVGYSNCNRYQALDPQYKVEFLGKNGVFSAAVADDEGGRAWSNMETFDEGFAAPNQTDDGSAGGNQTDNGFANNNQTDDGSAGNNQTDNGSGTNNQTDGGMANNNQSDGGAATPGVPNGMTTFDDGTPLNPNAPMAGIDVNLPFNKWDDNNPGNLGVTLPTPRAPTSAFEIDSNPSEGQAVNGMLRTLVCRQTNGQPGFQFLRTDLITYTSCQRCAIVDRAGGKCLLEVLPPPPQVARGGGDPLVIDMKGNSRGLASLELTSQEDGVLFDLFGARAEPSPHAKAQISWTDNPDYMYVVLPDLKGQVNGVNELFGDSTLGPDGRYSLDGFHALSKYDGMDRRGTKRLGPADGLIDKNDGVFGALKLWADTNFNGRAEQSEMKSLEEMGVVFIDLKYDPNFYEKDIYGNEAVFKSVVQFDDGHVGMVFDLWFAPLRL